MNAKKCKKIRASLRESGVDWREAKYQRKGIRGTIILHRGCGHSAYKSVKFGVVADGAAR